MSQLRIAQSIANLDAWLETMRQPGGYAGPVAHWWQNRFQYAGPGLDWRYEGILIGYTALFEKTRNPIWCHRVEKAALDLMNGQLKDGNYRASRFEMNPDRLGTPHEAAATLGLLTALPLLGEKERALDTAKRNVDNLIDKLWDGEGFNDVSGIAGRVPNKLATLAHALLLLAQASTDERYLSYADSALEDVLRYQEESGRLRGAVHQYAPNRGNGDGRFFPYYNARCIPPLVIAAELLDRPSYLETARDILGFIKMTMHEDGSWPQVLYGNGARAKWPRWVAGVADILLAYEYLAEPIPEVAFTRLLEHQLPTGGFPTAAGFGAQIGQGLAQSTPDYRDVVPVVGWNDKALRLLSKLLPDGFPLPEAANADADVSIKVGTTRAVFQETATEVTIRSEDQSIYQWHKLEPWARAANERVNVR